MSATQAIIGASTTLGYGSTLGGSYTSYGEVVDVKQPGGQVGKVEATHYTSPNFEKEWLSQKWKERDDVGLKLNYFKSQQTLLESHLGLQQFFKITLPDGSTWVFPGFMAKIGGEIPNQGKVECEASITVTGAPTFTAAT
jgi:hypothetical protein